MVRIILSKCTRILTKYFPFSTLCSAEITFKTDPKNTDYSAEHGASRNFEPWREEQAVEEEDRLAKLEEEENNPMKALENRTIDSKREMEILDALQDIRARNARNERVGQAVDLVARIGLDEVQNEEDIERKRIEDEDERLVRSVFSKVVMPTTSTANSSQPLPETDTESTPTTIVTVKRKADDSQPELHHLLSESARALITSKTSGMPVAKKKKPDVKGLGIKLVKKSKVATTTS
jgi:hypothetical protein